MRKNSHFSGQPLYGQVIRLLDKSKILQYSQEKGGERYTKRFNCDHHTVLRPVFQGCRPPSEDREKERRNQGAFQADETELPAEILLWRKRQRHQDPDMGDSDCKPAADGDAERPYSAMELFGVGHNGTDHPDVLRRLPQSVQQPGKGMGNHSFRGLRCTSGIIAF